MLVHDARSGETVAIDYREAAPATAGPEMYLDAQGNVVAAESRTGYRASGVPGTVAGLTLALDRYGTLPLTTVMAPAIRLAEEGIEVTRVLADSLERRRNTLARWPATRAIFLKPDGSAYMAGERLEIGRGAGRERVCQYG